MNLKSLPQYPYAFASQSMVDNIVLLELVCARQVKQNPPRGVCVSERCVCTENEKGIWFELFAFDQYSNHIMFDLLFLYFKSKMSFQNNMLDVFFKDTNL